MIFDVQQRRDGLCGVQDVDVIIQIVLEIVWYAVCHWEVVLVNLRYMTRWDIQ